MLYKLFLPLKKTLKKYERYYKNDNICNLVKKYSI
jgi:hypothetical protein